jgi:endogenous inhibitor of DNA gyrase (YacG/DUF329 family)
MGGITNRCPSCRGVVVKERTKAFPFCSDRCRLVDLGRWLNEEYRVPSSVPVDPDDEEGKQ